MNKYYVKKNSDDMLFPGHMVVVDIDGKTFVNAFFMDNSQDSDGITSEANAQRWADGLNSAKSDVKDAIENGRQRDVNIKVGQSLLTKDGRRTGNAIVTGIDIDDSYHIRTDFGNVAHLTRQELLSMFWVGDAIANPDEVLESQVKLLRTGNVEFRQCCTCDNQIESGCFCSDSCSEYEDL